MKRALTLLAVLLLTACATEEPVSSPDRSGARTFRIAYQVDLDDLPLDREVRLWVPLPQSDAHQTIRDLAVEGPWEVAIHDDVGRFGNRVAYLAGTPSETTAQVTVRYLVQREVHAVDELGWSIDGEPSGDLGRYLEPSALVDPDEELRQVAWTLASGSESTLERGRAFYLHVLGDMTYDKSGEGWGRGDALYACDVGRGNCTDFHAYFMALCLAVGIPSRFQIGLFGPYEAQPGEPLEVGGYHCWAEFHVPGRGWVPVDISEADKDPAMAETCFGEHTANRVTLSEGRDLILQPPQAGAPLNFFVDPYVEIDGVPHAGVRRSVTWTDVAD